MELYTHQLRHYDFNIEKKRHRKKVNGRVVSSYYTERCLDIFTFDLENSNSWYDSDTDSVIGYHKGEDEDYWNSRESMSLVYLWSFGVNDTYYYGRDLRDFINVLNDMPKCECQCFIHNLSHEFVFLLNILTPKDIFARAPHKPMKAVFTEYPDITFRCSYLMTNLSLADWGKQIGCQKLVGDLDYDSHLRTPLSHIEPQELAYSERDVRIVYEGVKRELEVYNTIYDIPLTSTGKVRKIVRERLFANKSYNGWIKRLVPNLDTLRMLIRTYQGGYCHCNRYHVDRLVNSDYMRLFGYEGDDAIISHFDFSSSYPTVLLSEKYATSNFRPRKKGGTIVKDKKMRDKYCFMYRIKFTNLESKSCHTFISASKCVASGEVIEDNGRVLRCYGDLVYNCTDADFDVINWLYDWDKIEILESYYATKDYLPKEFLEYILELYSDKTTLKNVKGQETFYSNQKARLNSLYGMCVTSLIPDECSLVNDEWVIKKPNENEIESVIDKLRDFSNNKYFLDFSWGVFCTAYARKNLFECALGIDDDGIIHQGTHNGMDALYFDTDSLFTMGRPDFSWYNDEIKRKLESCCRARLLDINKINPKDIKGINHPLGEFSPEESIKEFKCIHAKCYLERRFDDKLYMTISGINKGAVECLNNDFDNFEVGFTFDKDADSVKKLISVYSYSQRECVYPDGYVSTFKYGKNMRATGYNISIKPEYEVLINNSFKNLTDVVAEEYDVTFNNKLNIIGGRY